MEELRGMLVVMEFDQIGETSWVDQKTQVPKSRKFIKGHVHFDDRKSDWLSIDLPDDPGFAMRVAMVKGSKYLLPISVSYNKYRDRLRYVLRTDLDPMPAPELQ